MEMIHGIKNISKEGVRRYEAQRFKTPESAEISTDPSLPLPESQEVVLELGLLGVFFISSRLQIGSCPRLRWMG